MPLFTYVCVYVCMCVCVFTCMCVCVHGCVCVQFHLAEFLEVWGQSVPAGMTTSLRQVQVSAKDCNDNHNSVWKNKSHHTEMKIIIIMMVFLGHFSM